MKSSVHSLKELVPSAVGSGPGLGQESPATALPGPSTTLGLLLITVGKVLRFPWIREMV